MLLLQLSSGCEVTRSRQSAICQEEYGGLEVSEVSHIRSFTVFTDYHLILYLSYNYPDYHLTLGLVGERGWKSHKLL